MTGRIVLRTLGEDVQQIEGLVRSFGGFEQPTITRAALRLGITLLELEPSLLVVGNAPSPKRKQAIAALLHKKP